MGSGHTSSPRGVVARAEGPGPDGAGRYAVIAGGRRLAALQALHVDGVLGEDHPVPCLMAGNAAMSGELSLAENVVRIAMHPGRLVQQRLRLGNAATALPDAYRAEEIDLERPSWPSR